MENSIHLGTYLEGILLGAVTGIVLLILDFFFQRVNLRALNLTLLGLFFGYLMAIALNFIFDALLNVSSLLLSDFFIKLTKIFLFLFGSYLGVVITFRSSHEICLSIPFLRLTTQTQQENTILVDLSALTDPRMIDLAASGLLDKHLLIPRFLLKHIQEQEEDLDDMTAVQAKRILEVIQKLETLPHLNMRFQDTDFPDVKNASHKMVRLAHLLGAQILSADMHRMQSIQFEGIRVINMHALSNALKPLMQQGETLKIKIQRKGKEEKQGIGYLDDGAMVVVNGGGNSLGKTITASVLSVKHTTSGRMVFCNLTNEEKEKMHCEQDA